MLRAALLRMEFEQRIDVLQVVIVCGFRGAWHDRVVDKRANEQRLSDAATKADRRRGGAWRRINLVGLNRRGRRWSGQCKFQRRWRAMPKCAASNCEAVPRSHSADEGGAGHLCTRRWAYRTGVAVSLAHAGSGPRVRAGHASGVVRREPITAALDRPPAWALQWPRGPRRVARRRASARAGNAGSIRSRWPPRGA